MTIADVIDKLEVDKAGALVVTDDNHTILGLITERDIARGLKKFGRDVVDKPVGDLMTRSVCTCRSRAKSAILRCSTSPSTATAWLRRRRCPRR